MIFRIFFKDKRATDVEGDMLSCHSTLRLIMIDHNGKCVSMINIDEIKAVKALLNKED